MEIWLKNKEKCNNFHKYVYVGQLHGAEVPIYTLLIIH